MTKQIPLSSGGVVLVDDEDFIEISQHKWHLHSKGYAVRDSGGRKSKRTVYMHRQIAKPPSGMVTDHINGNRLDNRRCNLRVCLNRQNLLNVGRSKRNTSGYKGVAWSKPCNRWRAYVKSASGEVIHLGLFDSAEEAARAYNKAAKAHHGEFVKLNDVP